MIWNEEKIVAADILVLPGSQFLHQVWSLIDHKDAAARCEFIFPKPQTALSALGRQGTIRQILRERHTVRIQGVVEIRTRSYVAAMLTALLNTSIEAGLRKLRIKTWYGYYCRLGPSKADRSNLTVVDLVAWLQEEDFVKLRTEEFLRNSELLSIFHSLDMMPHCLPLLYAARPPWAGPVTFLAMSKSDEMGYRLFRDRDLDRIIVINPPRFTRTLNRRSVSKDERQYILLLLQSRSPRSLGIGPDRASQKDLVRVAKELSARLDKRILIRPHPSMSSWEVRRELFLSGLRFGFKLSRSIHADEIALSRIAVTDFSGLTPDCVAGGCPVLEVRMNFQEVRPVEFQRTQPTTQISYDYDYYLDAGLCTRLTNFDNLHDVVFRMLHEEDIAEKAHHLNRWLSTPWGTVH